MPLFDIDYAKNDGYCFSVRSAPKKRSVALLVDSVGSYGRGVIAGFAGYARRAGWNVRFEPTWRFDPQRRVDAIDSLDGILVQVTSRPSERQLLDSGIPAINCSNFVPDPTMPTVLPDDHAIGQLAAESFIMRGYKRFAYFGPSDVGFAQERLSAFTSSVQRVGPLSVCTTERTDPLKWLGKLEKQTAVFACNDHFALELLNHCATLSIQVPADVAVLGVDNDSLFAALSKPTLSSVMIPALEVGNRAAELLDRSMNGQSVPSMTRLAPVGVVSRESTATMPTSDDLVRQLCQHLAERFSKPIQIGQLAEQFSVSQRTIERRFFAATGRTLLDELHRLRIEEAKRLLLAGGLSIKQVALRSGYTDLSRFSENFRTQTGTTPTQFARATASW
jgi:LacI family transcriptional regulator